MNARDAFLSRGWHRFDAETSARDWADSVSAVAMAAARDPEHAGWHRHDNTWFAGVNALPNDGAGRVGAGPALDCAALVLARALYGPIALDAGQVSVVYPGYPRRDRQETEAAHRFRRIRDAAHVDGLKAAGAGRRRRLDEAHAFILGLPLGETSRAPLVVWEGSHEVVRAAFRAAYGGVSRADWHRVDLTDVYARARRRVFETCRRVECIVARGEATLVHRLALHGVAPWGDGGEDRDPRAIVYFRPALPGGASDWLELP